MIMKSLLYNCLAKLVFSLKIVLSGNNDAACRYTCRYDFFIGALQQQAARQFLYTYTWTKLKIPR